MAIDLISEEHAIERATFAVLSAVAKLRDAHVSLPMARSGVVMSSRGGRPTSLIRLTVREALEIGIVEYLAAVKEFSHAD